MFQNIFLLLFLCVIIYLIFLLINNKYNDFDNFNNINNWQKYLKNNFLLIKNECENIMNNVPIISYNRNKYWDDIDEKNIINKWILGNESIENSWLNYGLILNNNFIKENCKQCPNTYKILKYIIKNNVKIKVAGFSWLRPNSYIPFHIDTNDEIVYHLGLIIPNDNNAYIHVKNNDINNIIYHKEGHIITFNDNHMHSAVNNSNEERIILYLLI
jgi:hypothetical protein